MTRAAGSRGVLGFGRRRDGGDFEAEGFEQAAEGFQRGVGAGAHGAQDIGWRHACFAGEFGDAVEADDLGEDVLQRRAFRQGGDDELAGELGVLQVAGESFVPILCSLAHS